MIKTVFLVIALIACFFMFFYVTDKKSVNERVIFVVDISNSMNVEDIILPQKSTNLKVSKISRLKYIKTLIAKFIEKQENVDIGLVLFSEKASFLVAPTSDKEMFLTYLKSFSTNSLPFGGTNLDNVMDFVVSNDKPGTRFFLLSDMEVLDKFDPKNICKNKNKPNIIFVGIGSSDGGLVKYSDGSFVKSDSQNITSIRKDEVGKSLASKCSSKYYYLDGIVSDNAFLSLSSININNIVIYENDFNIIYMILGVLVMLSI